MYNTICRIDGKRKSNTENLINSVYLHSRAHKMQKKYTYRAKSAAGKFDYTVRNVIYGFEYFFHLLLNIFLHITFDCHVKFLCHLELIV